MAKSKSSGQQQSKSLEEQLSATDAELKKLGDELKGFDKKTKEMVADRTKKKRELLARKRRLQLEASNIRKAMEQQSEESGGAAEQSEVAPAETPEPEKSDSE